jgi:23S rRNA (guanosine2251-2'-O)-methyltransferase
VVPQRRQALERLVLHATSLRIPVVEVEGGTLTALAGFDGHQGIAIAVDPRRYATLEEILARAIELGEPPFVLALDSLEDPQNVGTLLRSAEAAGVHGVLFPTHRQAPLTPAAVKASAGAVEHLLMAPVDDLAAALADLHVRGLRVAGAEADARLTAREADLRGPIAIVVGSEGQGLGPAIRKRTDVLMRIPMRGAIDSLNAAVAGSILLFEAVAQRGLPERSVARPRPLAKLASSRAAPAEAPAVEPTASGAGATAAAQSEWAPEPAREPVLPEPAPEPVARPKRTRARRADPAEVTAESAPAVVPPPASAEIPGEGGAAADDASPPRTRRPRAKKASTGAADQPVTDAPATESVPPAPPRPRRSRARKADTGGTDGSAGSGDTAIAAEPGRDADELLPGGPTLDTTRPDADPSPPGADPEVPRRRSRRA